MKKMIAILTIMLMIILPSPITHAKSYTIDEVQIKGWVQPNGDLLVNEIFTYTFDGQFSEVTRSFPNQHNAQIDGFEAYLLNGKQPVVGEITNNQLTPIAVTTEDTTRTTKIDAKDKMISVFYVYTMKGAVKSYDAYSDIDITFFEKGSNHATDYKNVTISYVFPDAVGDINVHGFMYDKYGDVDSVYRDGIIFKTPESQAHSLTATRVFFPSFIMTEQQKGEAPVALDAAIAQEKKRLEAWTAKLSLVRIVEPVVIALSIAFIIATIVMLLLRQRSFALFGNTNLVLETDPVYLSFVDRNGMWHSKSFLAGLFSLVEKGGVRVKMEPAASRFRKHPDAPEKTLAFQLKKTAQNLLPYEQTLVTWLFKIGVTEREFHLHDIAGRARGEKANRKRYEKQQHAFEDSHHSWHEEVEKLMKEAGTFSSRLPNIIQWGIIVIILAGVLVAAYAAGRGGWEIALPLIASGIVLVPFVRHPGQLGRPMVFFGFMLFWAYRTGDGDLKTSLLIMVLTGIILYYATPSSIITSLNALYMKMSMNKFRSQVRNGLPQHLSEEQQNRWLARAYLLNKSTTKLPQLKGPLPTTLPLAALFTLNTDPIDFVRSTWGPSFYYGPSMGGSSYDSGGGYSGGGGGDGGGGGAGAD